MKEIDKNKLRKTQDMRKMSTFMLSLIKSKFELQFYKFLNNYNCTVNLFLGFASTKIINT